jgi:hypothetical protein
VSSWDCSGLHRRPTHYGSFSREFLVECRVVRSAALEFAALRGFIALRFFFRLLTAT